MGDDGATPTTAMILAAGKGERMRPLTNARPKPLVELGGRTLIDRVLDRLAVAGIERAVVNVHYLADMIEDSLTDRRSPAITISDERGLLLDTGGGVVRALPLLGDRPFVIHNSDSVWIETGGPALTTLFDAWDDRRMDSLMLLARSSSSVGYDGRGDFDMADDGALDRVSPGGMSPHVFAGVSIAHPRLFVGAPAGRHSLNVVWDRAIAARRLFGVVLDGIWMHVGTPDALEAAERIVAGEPRP